MAEPVERHLLVVVVVELVELVLLQAAAAVLVEQEAQVALQAHLSFMLAVVVAEQTSRGLRELVVLGLVEMEVLILPGLLQHLVLLIAAEAAEAVLVQQLLLVPAVQA